jgi:predicted O-methyltransferase YrrM
VKGVIDPVEVSLVPGHYAGKVMNFLTSRARAVAPSKNHAEVGIKMIRAIKSLLKSPPPDERLIAECDVLRADRDKLRAELSRLTTTFPPGHFYSPIPSLVEVHRDEARIFDRSRRELSGVDLNQDGQLNLLEQLKQYYGEQPFSAEPSAERRYCFENNFFSYSDALFLYCMIRFAQPRRIIEIGSGFSSFVMLDTNELFFDNRIRLMFIEPYDDRLRSRLRDKDLEAVEIISKRVQEVELTQFDELSAGDILFVDSSHVARVGSDVNHILFEILPRLAQGVFVHFHDMFYPFEYPKEWIEEGRFWNEDYFLRAFLQYNSAFKIRIWNQFLGTYYPEKLRESMPLCIKSIGGSLWLQRV